MHATLEDTFEPSRVLHIHSNEFWTNAGVKGTENGTHITNEYRIDPKIFQF